MEQYFQQSFSENRTSSSEEGKRYELVRFATFSNWPTSSLQYSTKLARAGFFYEGNGDEVVCYSCGVRTCNWSADDDPIIAHKQLSPDCKYFTPESGNVPVNWESVVDESGFIRRLDNLEIINEDTGLDQAVGGTRGHPNLTDATIGNRFPKSKSADQISNQISQSCPSSLSREPQHNTGIPRSTSFPSSSAGNQRKSNNNIPDSLVDKSGKAMSALGGETIHIGTKCFDLGKLRYEKNRLDTFKKWPTHLKVPPQDLAKSGFFYTGMGDRVMCVFCKGALRNWDEGDLPSFEHRKHFPKCRLVLGLEIGNVPLAPVPKTAEQLKKEQLSKDVAIAIDNTKLGNLGIITEKPKHSRYSIFNERLNTFKGWPTTKNQTPEQLAEAGFFYAGFGDNVKCFYCNGGLRNWEPGDIPWNEHAKWFKKCPFIKQVKGEAFIHQVQIEQKLAVPDEPIMTQLNPPQSPSQSCSGQHKRKLPLQSDSLGMGRVEEREVRARLDGASAKIVEDMGISRDLIARVIRRRLTETGDDFRSATELAEAVFHQQEEDETNPTQSAELQDAEDQTGSLVETNGESTEGINKEPGPGSDGNAASNDETATQNEDNNSTTKLNNTEDDKSGTASNSESDDIKKSVDDLEKENLDLKEQRLCKICMVADSSIVFLPCGHLVACPACSPALDNCPICRVTIKGFVRTFIA